MLEGQVLEHVLRLGKIEVLSARARYRAPNARALLIIANDYYIRNNIMIVNNIVMRDLIRKNFYQSIFDAIFCSILGIE